MDTLKGYGARHPSYQVIVDQFTRDMVPGTQVIKLFEKMGKWGIGW